MGSGGDLVRTVGDGISGLVGGAVGAIGTGIGAMIAAGQRVLPGPLFPIVVIGGLVLFFVWLVRK